VIDSPPTTRSGTTCAVFRRDSTASVLRYYEDLSEVETADLMGCSTGTVKSQVSAALGKLRERVGPHSGVLFPDDQAVTR